MFIPMHKDKIHPKEVVVRMLSMKAVSAKRYFASLVKNGHASNNVFMLK